MLSRRVVAGSIRKDDVGRSPKQRGATKTILLCRSCFPVRSRAHWRRWPVHWNARRSAFLDHVYLLCPPARVQPLFKVLSEVLLRHAGILFHQGKTKTWNKVGPSLQLQIVSAHGRSCSKVQTFMPTTPCHQASRQYIVVPTLGEIPGDRELEARRLSTLSLRMGGLVRPRPTGRHEMHSLLLSTAIRMFPLMWCEGWTIVDAWLNSMKLQHCWRVRVATSQLRDGLRSLQNNARDPGEWPHGTSSILDVSFRKMFTLSGRPSSCQAQYRSLFGHNSAEMALSHAPTALEFSLPPHFSVCCSWRGCGCPCC